MLDTKIARVKDLIAQKEAIDQELEQLLQGSVKKEINCGHCHQPGHSARKCPSKHGVE